MLTKSLRAVGLLFLMIWTIETGVGAYGPFETLPVPVVSRAERSLKEFIVDKFKRSEAEAFEIVKAAYRYGRSTFPTPLDVLAVIGVESSFDPKAVHPIGPSIGLMQINAKAHREEPKGLENIAFNVQRGVEILTQYSRGRTEEIALLAYNVGPAYALNCEDVCSLTYVTKVRRMKGILKKVTEE